MKSLTERFLHSLFGHDEEALSDLSKVLIWSIFGDSGSKHSFFTKDVQSAAAHAEKLGQRCNVYFGCGLQPHGLAHYERAKPHEVRGIPGIWADIDIYNPKAHSKNALPQTLDQAIDVAQSMPLLPTLIVVSGHGIQPWWLFKEVWMFEGADGGTAERQRAANAVAGWQCILKGILHARGWEHDATHDLSRVLRLPGTFNIKDPDDIRPVEVIKWSDARRYNPDDFTDYPIDDFYVEDFEASAHVAEPIFVPRFDAGLPEGFVTLMKEDPKVRATWEHTRKDMKDSSLSGFDMALAGFMAAQGDTFSDQDIADVIVAHRLRTCSGDKKEVEKGLRRDYLSRTIKRARIQRYAEVRTNETINSLDKDIPMETVTADAAILEELSGKPHDQNEVSTNVRLGKSDLVPAQKAKILVGLSAVLKFRILAVRKYLSDPPQYELVMPQGAVRVSDIGKLVGQNEFRKALAAAANIVIPGFKSPAWYKLCQSLLDCIEDVEVGDEATEAGICRTWLHMYLEENKPSVDIEGACKSRRPFTTKDERTYIFLESLREWLLAKQERIKSSELAVMLRRYGCIPQRYKVKIRNSLGEERETTRSVYQLPGE